MLKGNNVLMLGANALLLDSTLLRRDLAIGKQTWSYKCYLPSMKRSNIYQGPVVQRIVSLTSSFNNDKLLNFCSSGIFNIDNFAAKM